MLFSDLLLTLDGEQVIDLHTLNTPLFQGSVADLKKRKDKDFDGLSELLVSKVKPFVINESGENFLALFVLLKYKVTIQRNLVDRKAIRTK